MKTLLDAKRSTIPKAVGLAACDEQFIQYLNEAQERLAFAGRWWGSYKRMQVCATAGCIVWPREVMTVEGLNVCNYSIPLRNAFYEFQENVRPPRRENCDSQRQLLDRGTTPLFREASVASKVRLYPTDVSDVGKEIIIQGQDQNGVPIRSNIGTESSPSWIDGEKIILIQPFAESVNTFMAKGIDAVQKEITNQRVLVFGYDGTTESPLATWEPSETAPNYRRTFIHAFPCGQEWFSRACCNDQGNVCGDTNQFVSDPTMITTDILLGTDEGVIITTDEGEGISVGQTATPSTSIITCTGPRIDAIVRRQFIPALVDTDWLYIDNLMALKFAMMSMMREEANEPQTAERFWQQSLRALRDELDAYVPPQRLVVNVEIDGTAPMRRVMQGFR